MADMEDASRKLAAIALHYQSMAETVNECWAKCADRTNEQSTLTANEQACFSNCTLAKFEVQSFCSKKYQK